MKLSLPRWVLTTSIASSINLFSPSIAFAQEAPTEPQPADEAAAEVVAEDAPIDESQLFVSDGQPFEIADLGISMAAPEGWQVMTKAASLTVIASEPKDETPSYDKPKYQRNITVAAIHRASPIDEKRAVELKKQMMEKFGNDPLVSDFTVTEHKFFNYKGVNDGLLVYTSLNLGEYPMMQMHILVSGQQNQFLLTYTDLAERFTDEATGNFELAWNTMNSLQVTGDAPLRRDIYIRYGAVAGAFLMLICGLLLLRRKAKNRDFNAEADELDQLPNAQEWTHSIISTLHGDWRIDESEDMEFNQDINALESNGETDLDDDSSPKTKRTEYVSNF
jgi:hypothetical protein